MIKLKKIVNSIQNINVPSVLPRQIISKVLTWFPESRLNEKLRQHFNYLKRNHHILRLNQSEHNINSLLVQKNEFELIVNESPHLLFLAKQAETRSYFLSDAAILNPANFKTGDVIIPTTNTKYEVKSYLKLTTQKINSIIHQYKNNDFIANPIHMNIMIEDIKDLTIDTAKEKLSNNLGIPKNWITIISVKDMCEELLLNDQLDPVILNFYNISPFQLKDEYDTNLYNHIKAWFNHYETPGSTKRELDKLLNDWDNKNNNSLRLPNIKFDKLLHTIDEDNSENINNNLNDVD